MKRFGVGAINLVFAISVLAAPAGAQDKLVMGYGSGT